MSGGLCGTAPSTRHIPHLQSLCLPKNLLDIITAIAPILMDNQTSTSPTLTLNARKETKPIKQTQETNLSKQLKQPKHLPWTQTIHKGTTWWRANDKFSFPLTPTLIMQFIKEVPTGLIKEETFSRIKLSWSTLSRLMSLMRWVIMLIV